MGASFDGWANGPEARAALGAENEVNGERDLVLGFFYVGGSDVAAQYKARRGPIASKVRYVAE